MNDAIASFLEANQILIWVIAVVGAVIFIRRNSTKESIAAANTLATTRGEQINDLDKKLAKEKKERQVEREDFLAQLNELRGEIRILRAEQNSEIVVAVIEGVERILDVKLKVSDDKT